MENARYHLVFEGFKPDVNKTAVSFTLKDQVQLTDAQLADMMAGRRTVLKENLQKNQALKLGKELTQAGLIIKAQSLAVNQKNSPEEVRKHLLNGGLDQYFASKYRHESEEFDTMLSLAMLAGFAALTYIILPIIGFFILLPALSFSVWTSQFFAAIFHTVIAAIFFAPAVVLWPKPTKLEGLEIDGETEELLTSLINNIAIHLDAPRIDKIMLVENPVLTLHQTPAQWMRNSASIEVGLPVLEALTMQQFAGLLSMRLTPLSSTLFSRGWGLFEQWYQALRNRYKPWALLLNNWVLPMHDHQKKRGFTIATEVVGVLEAQRLQRIDKRFSQLNRDWPEFVDFCKKLHLRGTNWSALVAKEARADKTEEKVEALFRIESPALWALSTTDGYQKMFRNQDKTPFFEIPGLKLWQNFQNYIPLAEQFDAKLLKAEALVPPSVAPKKRKKPNAILLNKQSADIKSAFRQIAEQSLEMHAKPKKVKDIVRLTEKWQENSSHFWPDDFQKHKLFPLAKTVFQTLQILQEMDAWAIPDTKVPTEKLPLRDKHLKNLHTKWVTQAGKLPALPMMGGDSSKLIGQIQFAIGKTKLESLNPQNMMQRLPYWHAVMVVYWTFIAGQIIKPKTLSEEEVQQTA